MLVDPSIDDLMLKIDNKFKLVTLAMKRARDINAGGPEEARTNSAQPISTALHEIDNGEIYVQTPEEVQAQETENLVNSLVGSIVTKADDDTMCLDVLNISDDI